MIIILQDDIDVLVTEKEQLNLERMESDIKSLARDVTRTLKAEKKLRSTRNAWHCWGYLFFAFAWVVIPVSIFISFDRMTEYFINFNDVLLYFISSGPHFLLRLSFQSACQARCVSTRCSTRCGARSSLSSGMWSSRWRWRRTPSSAPSSPFSSASFC